ncbi:MAG: hypothetical protein LBK64_00475, partial [Spirochaetaceae bacterium]|nr:hypothetical protein [Spirochaetaceae bacterium]
MDDLFGTLIKFFPIILIVLVRILISGKKARPSRPPPPESFEEDETDDEESFKPHWEDDDEFRPVKSPFPAPNIRHLAEETEDRPLWVQRSGQSSVPGSIRPVVQSSVPGRIASEFRETAYKDRPALSPIEPLAEQAAPVPARETAPSEPLPGTRGEAGTELFLARLARYTPL